MESKELISILEETSFKLTKEGINDESKYFEILDKLQHMEKKIMKMNNKERY